MITITIHGKMTKLKFIKHILNNNIEKYVINSCKISKLSNFAEIEGCKNEYTLD